MLSANKEKIQSFFIGSNQFKIPFFQRAYVWKIDNWTELWDDIIEELSELKENNVSEHFIGTVIIKQSESDKLGALVYDLIDGQQRLTTICLLLKALHDTSNDINLKYWINNLLVFTDAYGKKNIRILHSKVDKSYFQEILLAEDGNINLAPANNKVVDCYLYFKHKLKDFADDNEIRLITTILLERLSVIHMALSKDWLFR